METSYWRVRPEKNGQVRVARDQIINGKPIPEHLEENGVWWPHPEGGKIPSISVMMAVNVLMKETLDPPAP